MTGQELIELIKQKGLENEEIFVEFGSTETGELMFRKIDGIEKDTSWYHVTYLTIKE
jgi:hypothetical protein